MRRSERAVCGFTLIELLAAMAIIGILAALLSQTLSTVKSRARFTVCKNQLRQMGASLLMYAHDYNRYPYLRSLPESADADSVQTQNNRWWWAKLEPYYSVKWEEKRYHCPGYSGAIAGVEGKHGPLGSYAYNGRGVRPPFGGWQNSRAGISIRYRGGNLGLGPMLYVSSPGNRGPSTSEEHVRMPSEMLAIGESRFASTQVNGIPGGYCDMTCGLLRWSARHGLREFAFDPTRHGKNYNQLFCDGHVAAMNPWTLFNPTNSAEMWNYDHQRHPELWPPE